MSTPPSPMRILQVISSSGYFGAENMILALMKGLAAHDCEVALASLLTPAGGSADLARQARGLGFESHEIDCGGRLDRASVAALRHVASSGSFDVVHSHGYKADLYVRLAIDGRRHARVATVHNWPVKTLKMRAYAALDKFALRGFDRVAAVSDAVLRELGRHGVATDRLALIGNGIDPAAFAAGNGQLRRELGLQDRPVLGYVGRLAAEKGLEDLLAALPGIHARVPGMQLLLIGDGPHRSTLEALAATLGLTQKVRFLGVRRDMADLYAAIDVLVLPSHDEGFPMTILEAMAAGKPVIATAVGQIPRMVIDHGTGRLVPPRAPEALTEALAPLLEDPALAARLGLQGQARVRQEFTASIMAGKYLELYRQARSRVAPARSVPVLFIVDELIEMGGAERALMRMIQHLPRERFTPTAITFRADLEQPLVRAFPCPLTVMPLGRTYNWNALQVARRIRAHIRRHGIQLVHTFFETSDLWGGLVAKSTGQVALISSRRDMGILRSRKHAIAYRLLTPLFDRVVAVSDRVRDNCRAVDGLPAERVVTVYNGIEDRTSATVARDEMRAGMGLGADDLVITTVGHIRHVKGVDVLAEAAARLRERFPTARFVVVGDAHEPDHMTALQTYVAAHGLERTLLFVGAREDIPAVLAASDIFVLPSRSEGFSNALVEAMLCSLPCVATDVGGNGEAVREGVNGFLVASEAAGPLSERLAALLEDPALRARMGREGRRIALATFTVQGMMEGLMDVYDAALRARRKAR